MKLQRTLAITGLALAISACSNTSEQPASPVVTNSTQGYQQAFATYHSALPTSYTGNADIDFATTLIPHSQATIDLSQVELKYGASPHLHKLATSAIQARTVQIKKLQSWLKTAGYPDATKYPAATTDNAAITGYKAALATQDQNLSTSYSSNADVDYATQLVSHDKGTIDLAKVELKNGKDKSLKKLASSIITNRTQEIRNLKSWLKWHADYVAGKIKPATKTAAKPAAAAAPAASK